MFVISNRCNVENDITSVVHVFEKLTKTMEKLLVVLILKDATHFQQRLFCVDDVVLDHLNVQPGNQC